MSKDRNLPTGGVPFGRHPALIVVDMSLGFTSASSPLGGDFDSEVSAACELVGAFHRASLPVFFSTVVYRDDTTQSVFRQHLPDLNILTPDSEWVNIDPRFAFAHSDIVIEKTGPSAFFDTKLAGHLRVLNCDALVICGLTTSGCVRATVVDALHYNYPTWVVEQACGDRNQSAHTANLHDMQAKYAQVVSLNHALTFTNSLS